MLATSVVEKTARNNYDIQYNALVGASEHGALSGYAIDQLSALKTYLGYFRMTKAIDPRQGLHRQLNLLEAYKVYETDYPLYLPDISATLAMNSPLYHHINETLTLQSLNKSEFESDEAQLRGAAMSAAKIPCAWRVRRVRSHAEMFFRVRLVPLFPQVFLLLSTAGE